jgi:glutathione peroxidase
MYSTLLVSILTLLLWSPNMSAHPLDNQTIKNIGGQALDLTQYKNKNILIVNIATQCGYTPQLKGLESLYQKYKEKNLVVIGIPSNDFGGQTPEAAQEVKKFCELNYGVTFPLSEKVTVKGEAKHPLIAALIEASGNNDDIAWNFEKFLVQAKDGQVLRFKSSVKPDDQSLISAIEKAQ